VVGPDNASFRELLRRHRLARALSQEALAERAGLSVDAIRALERGRRAAPRADTMARLADALALSPADRNALIAAATGQGEAMRVESERRPHPQALPTGGFLGSLAPGALIGRSGELGVLTAALEAAEQGEGRTVFLAGEAGIGKTRLGQEVTRRAAESGYLVLAGRCYADDQAVPYYPFLEIFAAAHGAAPPVLREAAGDRWPYLGVLVPDLLSPPPGGGTGDEQQRVFFAAGAFLAAIAADTPVLLLLDDLQWADSASLRLLRYIAHRERASRLLILATYRDAAAADNHPLQDVLRDLSREGVLQRVTIPRLALDATAALMAEVVEGRSISADLAGLIHARTGGNPFFISQLTRALVERGDLDRADGDAGQAVDQIELPETIRAVIQQRVRRLSAGTQQLLHEASILGDTFRVDDLARVTAADDEALDNALIEAERIGVIKERSPNMYGFDHGLTRQALYQALPARRRRRLHVRAGEIIESLPVRQREARAAELAWHFLEGDEPKRALPYALAAGDRAEAMFAHVEAELHYRTALQVAERLGEEGNLAGIHERLAAPLHRSGRYHEALDALERAAATYERQGDFLRLMPVMAEIAGVHGNRGTPAEGLSRLLSVLPRFESIEPSPSLIYLYASYGSLLFVLGRTAEHIEIAQRSVAIADTLDDLRARAVARAQLGLALLAVRRRHEGGPVLEEAMTLAEESGDLATFGHALNNVAYLAELRGDLDRSITLFERGLALSRRLGNPAQTVFMMVALARNYLYRGNWERARAYTEEAVQVNAELGTSWVAPYPVIGRGRLLLLGGEWECAQAELEHGLAIAEANADRQAREHARRLLAELDLMRGDPERAADHLAALGVTADGECANDGTPLPVLLTLARTQAALGSVTDALATVARVFEEADSAGEMLVAADALPLQATLLASAGDWAGAEKAYARGLELCRGFPYPYGEAQTLEAGARLFASRGMREQKHDLLREAEIIYHRLGATRDAARLAAHVASQ
jgi:tetratricopeptide (TPR) repeat protein/transcriptional regulator with XRE-family HTH domain